MGMRRSSGLFCTSSITSVVLPAVNTPGGARLVHDYLAERRERGLQPPPDPPRQVLAGGVLQSGHLVQVLVVQLLEKGGERLLDVGEVHHPPAVRTDGAADVQLDAERVAV